MAKKIALFSPYLNPVGTERVMLNLADGFSKRGYTVDLLRTYREWTGFSDEQDHFHVVDLGGHWVFPKLPRHGRLFRLSMAMLMVVALPGLVLYLMRKKPEVLLVGLAPAIALIARTISGANTRVVVTVQGWPRQTSIRRFLWRKLYLRADAIVAPSIGVANEVARIACVDIELIRVIPNPVLDNSVPSRASEVLEHPWFCSGQPPVVLGVGRLTRQKNFEILIRAFAEVKQDMAARLVILGEGEARGSLEKLIAQLNVNQDVELLGHVQNPYKFMARAGVFVLSSRWEGPGHVLIEALAVGAPVVSTDCPSGPREILLDGQAGLLIPVGDWKALAGAILDVLQDPEEARRRSEEARSHIVRFHTDSVVAEYLKVIEAIHGH